MADQPATQVGSLAPDQLQYYANNFLLFSPNGQPIDAQDPAQLAQLPKDAAGNVQVLGAVGGSAGQFIPQVVSAYGPGGMQLDPATGQPSITTPRLTPQQAVAAVQQGTSKVSYADYYNSNQEDGSFLSKYGWALPLAGAGIGALAAGGTAGVGGAAATGAADTGAATGAFDGVGSVAGTGGSAAGMGTTAGVAAGGGAAATGAGLAEGVPGAGAPGAVNGAASAADLAATGTAAGAGTAGIGSYLESLGLTGAGLSAATSLLGPLLSAGAGVGASVAASNALQQGEQQAIDSQTTATGQEQSQLAAANQQAQGTIAANTAQTRADQQPYMDTGTNALQKLNNMSPSQILADDPGYQFRLDQGTQALENSASARGAVIGGGAMTDVNNYAQGQASQEYGSAWNRLLGLAGIGQTAANTTDQLGQTATGQSVGATTGAANTGATLQQSGQNAITDAITGAANARASGYVSAANSVSNGVSQAVNTNNSQNLIQALLSKNATSTSGYTP